ncbi:MAG: acyltransferase [Pseudomonadota bacterium]
MNYLREHIAFLTTPGKYGGIDLMRASAVLLVMLFHFQMPGFRFGWIGVDVFFVVSGFLIGGMIRDQILDGQFSFRQFYWSRALRILPVYYLFIFLCWVFKANGQSDWSSILMTMTFLQTTGPYFFGWSIDFGVIPGGTWTLVIEEYFYLCAPLVLFALYRFFSERIVTLCLCLVFLSGIAVRLWATAEFNPNDPNWHFASFIQFHSRYDELTAGVIAAIAVRNIRLPLTIGLVLSAIGVVWIVGHLIANGYWFEPQSMTRETIWYPTVLGMVFGLLAVTVANVRVTDLTTIFIARLSYPLYLGHIFAAEISTHYRTSIDVNVFGHMHLFNALFMLGCVAFAYLLSLLVEYPFIRVYRARRLRHPERRPEAVGDTATRHRT